MRALISTNNRKPNPLVFSYSHTFTKRIICIYLFTHFPISVFNRNLNMCCCTQTDECTDQQKKMAKQYKTKILNYPLNLKAVIEAQRKWLMIITDIYENSFSSWIYCMSLALFSPKISIHPECVWCALRGFSEIKEPQQQIEQCECNVNWTAARTVSRIYEISINR